MSFFRYLEVLRYVNSSPEARLRTVQIAAAFWKDNTQVSRLIHIPIIYSFANIQFLGIILDKLLNYRVIDPASIITWVFETQQSDSAYRFYAWEILQNTMSKVVARVGQVRVKLEDAEKTHKENEAKRAQEESNESKYHSFPLLSSQVIDMVYFQWHKPKHNKNWILCASLRIPWALFVENKRKFLWQLISDLCKPCKMHWLLSLHMNVTHNWHGTIDGSLAGTGKACERYE